jgi:4-alpha-glucanotransferase
MLIQFQITYRTFFGQQIMLTGSLPQLGSGERVEAVTMHYMANSDGIWTYLIRTDGNTAFDYRYFLRNDHVHSEKEEWGENRVFDPKDMNVEIILLRDHWRSFSDPDTALLSSAFTNAVFKSLPSAPIPVTVNKDTDPGITLSFSPLISRMMPGHRVMVSGSPVYMGKWKEENAIPMDNQQFPHWLGEITIPVSEFPVQYKYMVQNEVGEIRFWEKCPNRVISLPEDLIPDLIGIRDEVFDFPVDPWKGAGIAIPVFSLRRENGWGIGEFSDLKGLTDWAAEAGLQLIQTLPVNDTIARHTWKDSYPYAAISVLPCTRLT